MPRFLADTSCIVAFLCSWHDRHRDTVGEMAARLAAGEEMIVAAPALVEVYSVLTRLPAPRRVLPAHARELVETNFNHCEVVALDPAAYRRLLEDAAAHGWAGGAIYDAVIAFCGLTAGVDAVLTFNQRHFRPFARLGLEIVVPPTR